jgi:hypothetical protein
MVIGPYDLDEGAGYSQLYYADLTVTYTAVTYEALAGEIAGAAGITGAIARTRGIGGTVAGQAGIAAALSRARAIGGVVAAQSALVATLRLAIIELIGSIAGASGLAAALSRERGLSGSADGSSDADASMSRERGLSGSIASEASLNAALVRITSLVGSVDAVSTLMAILLDLDMMSGVIAASSGMSGILRASTSQTLRGQYTILQQVIAGLRGLHRSKDDAVEAWELYRGIDAAPDFDSAPWETFTASPHDTAALDPAPAGTERTYYFVLRRRNAWGLLSGNVTEWTLTVDDTGAEVVTRPSAPAAFAAEAAAGGTINVTASYIYAPDGDYAASQWLIYAEEGVDPDPEIDTPTAVSMIKADGTAKLDWDSGAYADDTVVHVLVRTRRVDEGPVNVDSDNLTAVTAVADTAGPSAPTGSAHFGDIAEQRQ